LNAAERRRLKLRNLELVSRINKKFGGREVAVRAGDAGADRSVWLVAAFFKGHKTLVLRTISGRREGRIGAGMVEETAAHIPADYSLSKAWREVSLGLDMAETNPRFVL